jgi:putative flippase GtrA
MTMTVETPAPLPLPEPEPVLDHRSGLMTRLRRCMSVSVLTTLLSLSIILTGTVVFGIAAALANVIATSVATIPSYHLNRRWTWGRRDPSHPWREVMPFWVLSFCGLALSTLTVALADSWAKHLHLSPLVHTGTIVVGHLSGFGALWVLQFWLLDRVLFARPSHVPTLAPDAGDLGGGARA